jgi:hypothetical protein
VANVFWSPCLKGGGVLIQNKCQTEDLWCVRLQDLYVHSTGRRLPALHGSLLRLFPSMDRASIRRDYPQGMKVQLSSCFPSWRDETQGMGRGDVRLFSTVQFEGSHAVSTSAPPEWSVRSLGLRRPAFRVNCLLTWVSSVGYQCTMIAN